MVESSFSVARLGHLGRFSDRIGEILDFAIRLYGLTAGLLEGGVAWLRTLRLTDPDRNSFA